MTRRVEDAVAVKVAVTVTAAESVKLQVLLLLPPVHDTPLQPPNVEPELGDADSVTVAPETKVSAQSAPQLTPAGTDVIVPVPPPALDTFKEELKVATTMRSVVMLAVQVPVPEQAPDQPENVLPGVGVAVKTADAPETKSSVQSLGHAIPVPVMLPPAPLVTETINENVVRLNVAVTFRAEVMGTEQTPVPAQAPVHPVKVDPAPAFAMRVTVDPAMKLPPQTAPQSIALGVEVTDPVPLPASATFNG